MTDDRPFLSAHMALSQALGPLDGLDAVDLGAGGGAVTRVLAALGANALGVEPNDAARARAEAAGGRPSYVSGTAEATGLGSETADLVVFSLSLHHCEDMPGALREACRLLRPGGRLAVMEPQAPDPMWPVMRWIDDESAVYAQAQDALAALVTSGRVGAPHVTLYADRFRVTTLDAMIEEIIAIDPRRRVDEGGRAEMETAFAAALERDAEGAFLPHWMRLDVVQKAV